MFHRFYEGVPDALLVVDEHGQIVFANHQAERLFGYPPDGLTSLELELLLPERLREVHRGYRAAYALAPRLRTMGGTSASLIGQRRDGAQFPIEVALSPLQSDEGLHFLATVRDISESQRSRQAMVRARYDALVARVGQLALESGDEVEVIDQLPAMLAEVLGIEAMAVLLLPSDQEAFEIRASIGFEGGQKRFELPPTGPLRAQIDGRAVIIEDLSIEPLAQREWPLGGATSGSLAIMPLPGRGRPLGALIARASAPHRFDHDARHLLQSVANLLSAMVQRRRTEEQLAHSHKLDALGQLTGGIAHDFNNLLTIISGNLQLLEIESAGRQESAELVSSALRSAAHGAELTGKLLAFARRQRLTPSAVHAQSLLHDLELMLKGTFGEAIRLRVECAEGIPAAYVDATQFDTALVNLALNARDAMPRGGEITIQASERWVTAEQASPELGTGHYVVFSVSDTGRGMAPKTLARAAEPFFTTKASGHGTGLGLSMVYGFVKQSGGHLLIDSRLGYGTRVELYLPVAPAVDTSVKPASPQQAAGAGELVLVVEDEPEVRTVAASFLRSLGYRVVTAGNAREALQHLQEEPSIALLFSDVMLGAGLDGKELAHAARSLRPDLAVLLTSGYDAAAADAEADHAFEVLRKPYQREQLGLAIRRELHRKS